MDKAVLDEEIRTMAKERDAQGKLPTTVQKTAGIYWREVFHRKEVARRAYETTDPIEKERIAREFDVRAIVWGELERAQYPLEASNWLRETFGEPMKFGADDDAHRVWIYRVPQG